MSRIALPRKVETCDHDERDNKGNYMGKRVSDHVCLPDVVPVQKRPKKIIEKVAEKPHKQQAKGQATNGQDRSESCSVILHAWDCDSKAARMSTGQKPKFA
jgi:hypothetical protein